ncbi:MAG: hypothetical protein ACFHU9_02305 [Fluviicola sp.]
MKFILVLFLSISTCANAQSNLNTIDTIAVHSNGNVSVTKTKVNTRQILWKFYDSNGKETFQLDEFHGSHSITVSLSISKTGEAISAKQTVHPGGSRYWNEYTITFREENVPFTMTKEVFPVNNLEGSITISYWDKNEGKWSTKKPQSNLW